MQNMKIICDFFLLSLTLVVSPVAVAGTTTWNDTHQWDFQCHSHSHPHLQRISVEEIRSEMEQVDFEFAIHGFDPPAHHAYPFGGYDSTVQAAIAEYRLTGRAVWGFMLTYPVTDWFEIMAAQLKASTGSQRIRGWVDDCIAEQALLHIFTHDVSENPSNYGTTIEKLKEVLDYIVEKKNAGILDIVTMSQAYDYWSTAAEGKAMVVVSFDDSNESDYSVVYPMFQERSIKGTSYLTTGYMEQPGFLTWDMIEEMQTGLSPPPPSNLNMYVMSIVMSSSKQGPSYQALATVTVMDEKSDPVADATVHGEWSNLQTLVNGVTDMNGQVTLRSEKVRGGGTFTFRVTNITKMGWTYSPHLNLKNETSITVP
jgi:peptidoglycan/xylan/chitin deacetylase (PgdA/CDA1 family)